MEDVKILEAIERYIGGQMSPDERVHFEQLRKTNPEIDQMVVEHTYFLQQLNRYDEISNLKHKLNEVHIDLAQKGLIQSPKLRGKAKVVYLFNRYKRTAAIAASIAGITVLTMSALIWSFFPAKPVVKELQELNREISALKNRDRIHEREITRVKQIQTVTPPAPTITYKSGGTGFLIDAKGYVVTNAHVIQKAVNVAVQNTAGKDFRVSVVYKDAAKDLAILKIEDTAFKAPAPLPYGIKKTSADIAEPVFTLGYPRNDIVYGEGYLAAKTGYNGDTLTCQIAIAANPGNSGGPVINKNGEIIGVLSTKQVSAEGVVFATQAKYIYDALNELQKDTAYKRIKIPAASSVKGLDRVQQVKKIEDYVFMVKVD